MSVAARAGVAVATGCAAATLLYAGLRVAAHLVLREPDPAEVLYSEHAGYFWRALTSMYLGGMAGFAGWVAAGRELTRAARAASSLIAWAAVALVVQAVVLP